MSIRPLLTHAAGFGRACHEVSSETTISGRRSGNYTIGSWRRAVTSVIRDKSGRYVPLVRPKQWKDGSIRRSRDRTERIARAKTQQKAWLTTTEWISSVDDRTIAALEAEGIPWSAVLRWLDEVNPREAFTARMLV